MKIILILLLIAIHSTSSSSEENAGTSLDTSRSKRSLWLDDMAYDYNTEGAKYSWFCRDCDMGFQLFDREKMEIYNICTAEGERNGETYSKERCTGKQACELMSTNDIEERPVFPAMFENEYLKDALYTPGGHAGHIVVHRYCCDKHGICNLRMSEQVKPALCVPKANIPWGADELFRRTCCQLAGERCDEVITVDDQTFIDSCKRDSNCGSPFEWLRMAWQCCGRSNATCTIPTCDGTDPCNPLPGNTDGHCLVGYHYGFCCEFLGKCNGLMCDLYA